MTNITNPSLRHMSCAGQVTRRCPGLLHSPPLFSLFVHIGQDVSRPAGPLTHTHTHACTPLCMYPRTHVRGGFRCHLIFKASHLVRLDVHQQWDSAWALAFEGAARVLTPLSISTDGAWQSSRGAVIDEKFAHLWKAIKGLSQSHVLNT